MGTNGTHGSKINFDETSIAIRKLPDTWRKQIMYRLGYKRPPTLYENGTGIKQSALIKHWNRLSPSSPLSPHILVGALVSQNVLLQLKTSRVKVCFFNLLLSEATHWPSLVKTRMHWPKAVLPRRASQASRPSKSP